MMQFLPSHKVCVSLLQVFSFFFFPPEDISHVSFLFSCISLVGWSRSV